MILGVGELPPNLRGCVGWLGQLDWVVNNWRKFWYEQVLIPLTLGWSNSRISRKTNF